MSEPVKHTPGPWKWVKRTYTGSKTIELIHPQNGYLTVMDFVRLGMQSGTFRLATWKGDERGNMGGIMVPAHELDIESHPDARLIAAAPELLAELERAVQLLRIVQRHLPAWNEGDEADVSSMEAAIAKARGLS